MSRLSHPERKVPRERRACTHGNWSSPLDSVESSGVAEGEVKPVNWWRKTRAFRLFREKQIPIDSASSGIDLSTRERERGGGLFRDVRAWIDRGETERSTSTTEISAHLKEIHWESYSVEFKPILELYIHVIVIFMLCYNNYKLQLDEQSFSLRYWFVDSWPWNCLSRCDKDVGAFQRSVNCDLRLFTLPGNLVNSSRILITWTRLLGRASVCDWTNFCSMQQRNSMLRRLKALVQPYPDEDWIRSAIFCALQSARSIVWSNVRTSTFLRSPV